MIYSWLKNMFSFSSSDSFSSRDKLIFKLMGIESTYDTCLFLHVIKTSDHDDKKYSKERLYTGKNYVNYVWVDDQQIYRKCYT